MLWLAKFPQSWAQVTHKIYFLAVQLHVRQNMKRWYYVQILHGIQCSDVFYAEFAFLMFHHLRTSTHANSWPFIPTMACQGMHLPPRQSTANAVTFRFIPVEKYPLRNLIQWQGVGGRDGRIVIDVTGGQDISKIWGRWGLGVSSNRQDIGER
jgi:hypothetical protein